MALTLYAYARGSGRKLTWSNVESVAYTDEVQYDADTYRNNFGSIMKAVDGNGEAYVQYDPVTATNVAIPDEVQDAVDGTKPPNAEPHKYTIATLTITDGGGTQNIKVRLCDLEAGAFFTA